MTTNSEPHDGHPQPQQQTPVRSMVNIDVCWGSKSCGFIEARCKNLKSQNCDGGAVWHPDDGQLANVKGGLSNDSKVNED